VQTANAVVQDGSGSPSKAGQPPSARCNHSKHLIADSSARAVAHASVMLARHVASTLACCDPVKLQPPELNCRLVRNPAKSDRAYIDS
jgi:hypothetical protein